MLKFIVIAILSVCLVSCATEPLKLSESAEKDFLKAQSLIDSVEYARAVQYLEKFSAKYPYSKYVIDAKALRIEAAYLDEQYILSETLSIRFLDSHPAHEKRSRIQYLLAMSFYNEASDATRDQKFSNKALTSFITLNKDFPNHPKLTESKQYIQELTDRIAKHEFIVGEFYYDKELYVGAINRFITIKNKYPSSQVSAESLYYLAASYHFLNRINRTKETIDILSNQHPKSKWHKKALELI